MMIKNREDLYKQVEKRMLKSLTGRRLHQYEENTGVPKIYVLETVSGLDEKDFFDRTTKEITEILGFSVSLLDSGSLLEMKKTNDSEEFSFYFDPYLFYDIEEARFRFVPVFTFAHSMDSDRIINRLVKSSFFFDNQWIHYEDIQEDIRENYIREIDSEFNGEYTNEPDLSLSFSSKNSDKLKEVFSVLDKNKWLGFFNAYRYYYEDSNFEMPFQAFHYSNGKMTLYGNGFEKAIEILKGVTQKYSESLTLIEKNAENLDGVFFVFRKKIYNPCEFLKKILNDSDSKLISFGLFESEKQCETMAADMHVGGSLNILITEHIMRVIIGTHSCANSVKRLLTILRKKYDPYLKVIYDFQQVETILVKQHD